MIPKIIFVLVMASGYGTPAPIATYEKWGDCNKVAQEVGKEWNVLAKCIPANGVPGR